MKVKLFWNFDIIVATPMKADAMVIGTGNKFPPLFSVCVKFCSVALLVVVFVVFVLLGVTIVP